MIAINNNTWSIETELTLKTVPGVYKKYSKNLTNVSNIWNIDFKSCPKLDSSGLSLIIEYIKYAENKKITLKLHNIDSKTLSLAKVHGIKNILEQFIS
jgi:phospholipid transport system transporter-binding protein